MESRVPVGWENVRGTSHLKTLWTYYQLVTPEVSPKEHAKALEMLHTRMRKVDVLSPSFWDRITEAQKIVANPESSPRHADADREFLGGRLADVRRLIEERGATEQLPHGEQAARPGDGGGVALGGR